jgi:hypothetical protein
MKMYVTDSSIYFESSLSGSLRGEDSHEGMSIHIDGDVLSWEAGESCISDVTDEDKLLPIRGQDLI